MSSPAQNRPAKSVSDDEIVVFAAAAVVLLAAGPSLLASAGINATSWLLAHHVLVPPGQALFQVPFLQAGPDVRRLLVALLVLVAVPAVVGRRRHHSAGG